jgi:hypothetical protein
MKGILAAIVLGLASTACSPSQTPQERLVGDWVYVDSTGTVGEGVDLKPDGTYAISVLQLTTATTGNAQQETGTYTATDSDIRTTPQEWTCPGPDPVAVTPYSFSGNLLVVTGSSGLITFSPNTAPASTAEVLTFGCFQANGSFVAEALAPVSN